MAPKSKITPSLNCSALFANQANELASKFDVLNTTSDLGSTLITRSLCLNAVVGGGFRAGTMYVFSGMEGGAKSTAAQLALGASLDLRDPVTGHDPFYIRQWIDAESAFNPDYAKSVIGMEDDFNHLIEANAFRYAPEGEIETVFPYLASVIRRLPTKSYNKKADLWGLRFKKEKGAVQTMKDIGAVPDTKLSSEFHYFCPIANNYSGPHGLIVIDSLAALMTSALADAEAQKKEAMAATAAALSKHLKTVVGPLRKKGVVLVCTNQLREDLKVLFGPTEKEPGGNAIKFFSGSRTGFRSCAASTDATETSVEFEDGTDTYLYKKLTGIKNRFGIKNVACFIRVWTSDGDGNVRGVCPVFDTFEYLRVTGRTLDRTGKLLLEQAKGVMRPTGPFSVIHPKTGEIVDFKSWYTFKRAVLMVSDLGEQLNLREACFEEQEQGNIPGIKTVVAKDVSIEKVEKPKKGSGDSDLEDTFAELQAEEDEGNEDDNEED